MLGLVLRLLSALAAVVGVVAYGYDIAAGAAAAPRALGQWLYQDLGVRLEALQAGVQRYLAPWLWDAVALPILLTPSVLVFGLLGLALGALGWALGRRA